MKTLILMAFFALAFNLHAKRFSNQYIEFELPPGWSCLLEGSEYVCQAENKERQREAIIIMAAKERGQQDSLDQYQAYLNQKKTYTLPGGKTQVSEPKYTKVSEINTQKWIDSLHLASEVPGFYTRYMATVKQTLGIAVTFSVAKDNYNDYQALFDKMIASMRVFVRAGAANNNWVPKSSESNLLDETSIAPDEQQGFNLGRQGKQQKKPGMSQDDLMMYGIIAGVVVVFFILKKLKK